MSSVSDRKTLIADLEKNRIRVADDLAEFGESVNLTHRFKDSVREHPAWWIGGGVLGGIVLSRLLASQGHSRSENGKSKKSPIFLGLLGIAAKEILRISTPALKQAAGQHLEQWITDRSPQPTGENEDENHPIPNQESS